MNSPFQKPLLILEKGTAAATTQFTLDSLQGLTAKELNPGAALMAKEVFTRGLTDLPDDMLHEGAMAQYSTCKVARQELITATWKVEASTCWSKFLASASKHLETQHDYCKTDLEIWEQACTNHELKDLFHNKAFYKHSTSQGTLTLAVLQEQARQLKEYVEERGADTDGDRSEGSRSGGSDYEPSEYDNPSFHNDVPSSAISIMPPKSTQGKKPQWKKPQNSRQICKPARRSNENPCLNADDSQVGCAVEQTEQPELECDDMLSVLHEEEMLDSESDDFDDAALQHELPQSLIYHQPPYNNHHPEQYSSVYHPPFPQHEPQMHVPPFQPQHIQHPEMNQVPFQRPFMPQTPFPPMNQPPYQPPYAHQTDNLFHQHRPHLNWMPSLQRTMTTEELFLSCSINEPLPPTVHGADRLSRHLQDPEAQSMRPSPYALPGLWKVTVFGPVVGTSITAVNGRTQALFMLEAAKKSLRNAVAHPHPHAQPIQSHNDGGSNPHLNLPQQEAQTTQANPPIPIPAERVDENIAMVHAALAEAIASTLNLLPGQYYFPDTETFITSLTKITGTIRTVVKAAVRIIAQHKYELGLNIWDTSSEVARDLHGHLLLVPVCYYHHSHCTLHPTLHLILPVLSLLPLFWHSPVSSTYVQATSAFADMRWACMLSTGGCWDQVGAGTPATGTYPWQVRTLDGILQSVTVLEHDRLVSLVIEILWAHGFYKDIKFDDPTVLDGVIALAGAVLCSALLEYKAGTYKRVEFSTAKLGDTYQSILIYISNKIYPRAELAGLPHRCTISTNRQAASMAHFDKLRRKVHVPS
ncbi:hypothetical protein BDR03DRAFT_983549 [Suillus americanus]|nr:hypothetical protein BDR03DRAFT_983549 [Suillus americanus]